MGSFYSNITVRHSDQSRVAELLRGRRAVVSPEQRGYTVVFDSECDEPNWPAVLGLAERLSRELSCATFAVIVEDNNVLCFVALSGGEKLDEYNSCPSYYDFGSTGPLQPPSGGNAVALAGAFSGDAAKVERVLRRWSNDEPYAFASDRHEDLAAELGLPRISVGNALASFTCDLAPEGISPSAMLWAADPPAPVDPRLKTDQAFYDRLGSEDPEKPCKQPGCTRGAIQVGTRCRRHHFEMVQGRPCPFD